VTRVTYAELYHRVCQFANGLKSLGITKGDRVLVYMPMSIEAVVAMQACARIGAIHSVVFGGFSAKSVTGADHRCRRQAGDYRQRRLRGGKAVPLKAVIDEALATGRLRIDPESGGISAHQQRLRQMVREKHDIWWHKLTEGQSEECEPTWVNAEDPLFILYTSGSTGKPKGVQHSSWRLSAGRHQQHALGRSTTSLTTYSGVLPTSAGLPDTLMSTYGPLAVGATQMIFEGVPTYPDAGRFWKMIERTQGHHLLHRADRDPLADQARAPICRSSTTCRSLRLLGTVGEPINPEAWMWYYETVGKRSLPDCRYLVADRNRRPYADANAGGSGNQTGLLHAASTGHHHGHRR
jgi:acetyl-CoA synthetase